MKEYVIDFVTGTIVAAVLTLISYIVGFDETWDDVLQGCTALLKYLQREHLGR
jgi:hypothetical protein